MSAKRAWGESSWVAMPELCGSGSLNEQIPVKEGLARGREPSARGKWEPWGLVLGVDGWKAVTEMEPRPWEMVRGETW